MRRRYKSRTVTPLGTCGITGKTQYRSREDAKWKCHHREDVVPYRCPVCHLWHLKTLDKDTRTR